MTGQELVIMLVSEFERSNGCQPLALPEIARSAVLDILEPVLLCRQSYHEYTKFLREELENHGVLLVASKPVTSVSESILQIVEHGLGALPNDRLLALALSLNSLDFVRRSIEEAIVSDHHGEVWTQRLVDLFEGVYPLVLNA